MRLGDRLCLGVRYFKLIGGVGEMPTGQRIGYAVSKFGKHVSGGEPLWRGWFKIDAALHTGESGTELWRSLTPLVSIVCLFVYHTKFFGRPQTFALSTHNILS